MFRWAFIVLDDLLALFTLKTLQRRLLFSPLDLSTHFSGIGTAELAAHCLDIASQQLLGHSLGFAFVSSCESAPVSQRVLKQRVHADTCIITDVLARCPAAKELFATSSALGCLPRPVEEIWNELRLTGCKAQAGKCYQHNSLDCPTPRSKGDLSGTPCQCWSTFGLRKTTSSHLIILLLVWALWVRWAKPLFLVHENVRGFEPTFLEWLLGDMYDMVTLRVDPSHMGLHFARRPRIYVVLWLIEQIVQVADITKTYLHVTAAFEREFPCRYPLSSAFISTEEEQQQEYDNSKKKKQQQKKARLDLEEVRPSAHRQWEGLLTDKQRGYLKMYLAKWKEEHYADTGILPEEDPSCLFDLSQDPAQKPRQSRNGMAPTAVLIYELQRSLFFVVVPGLGPCLSRCAFKFCAICVEIKYVKSQPEHQINLFFAGMT